MPATLPPPADPVVIRALQPGDRPAVRDLLRLCGLPVDDLDTADLALVVAVSGAAVLGCAGLEGPAGATDLLFRSLAVSAAVRGQGLGNRLLEDAVERARLRGATGLWLLTTGTREWFRLHGFRTATREEAPEDIRHTAQFAGLCPSSSHLMHRTLDAGNGLLTPAVLRYIDRSVLCWLATVDAQGRPNVSPKEIFTADGDSRLLIAHIASPGSVRNLENCPHACVSFVDVFVQRGYKLRGTAEVVRPAEEGFDRLVALLAERTGGLFPIHAVIVMEVTQVEPVLAPSYVLVPGTTEESQLAAGLRNYGVVRPGRSGADPGFASGEPGNRDTSGRTAP